jgi:hypothetical protein
VLHAPLPPLPADPAPRQKKQQGEKALCDDPV